MVLLRELLLLTFIFLAYAPSSMSALGTSTSIITDHLALMSFKSQVTMDPSGALVQWGNLSVPMCQWPGVACGFKGSRLGRVVALKLAGLNLVGTITTALGNLTYLRLLDLSSNSFHGILPPELGNLHDLKNLVLEVNSIQGKIPPSLTNCTHLVSIILDTNNLEGEIPSEFSSLHNLKYLYLGDNKLTGTIPAFLGNLSALTNLSLAENELEGSIPPLQSLLSLRVLQLRLNKLEGTIPPWLANLSSLVYLNLGQNGLVGHIPESLGNLELLTVLSLAGNKLSGSIPHSIGNLHALNGLLLYNNNLEGSLPHSMFNLSSLDTLEIDHNNLTGTFPPDTGSRLSKLQSFFISFNQFHGVLPSSICNASMLQEIETASTFLSGTIPQCLGIHQMDLYYVSLGNSEFEATNDDDWGFIASLTNCSNMRLIDLHSNKLKGVLPNSIANFSIAIKYLNIEHNKITGTIPGGIGNLINLETLGMGQNILLGAIPSSLCELKKVNILSLFNNILSGPIPVSLGNLTQLTKLYLWGNHISGPIPSSLENCPLELLNLSYNKLFGSIPKELFFISTLSIYMDLSHNSLSGTLPSEVGNLKNINEIDFSSNMIHNEIPDSISGCQSLVHLNLSRNILQGTIPASLETLRGLFTLDLSYNNLSGTIPETIGRLVGLSSLNLSFNKFVGRVPTDGAFQNASAVLVTGNDGLCGGIPQLKLPPCPNHTTKKPHQKLAMIVSICSASFFVTLVLLALCALQQKSQKTKAINLQRSIFSEQYVRISFAELVNATNGFASENIIGAGSFGSVYKGKITVNGQDAVVAVKVLNLMQRGASQSFVAECNTLRCARHRNLVKILTVCSSIDFQGRDFKALVYEFLPNGNLDQWLHQQTMEKDGEQKSLQLIARLHIAIDVAASLDYLHQHKPTPIVHCDLKPSNVLLDCDLVAHVGDFGLARFLHQDKDESSGWASMRGSIGYAAPEYGLGNGVSTHGDVYSFGILLLEMMTGKRPTDNEFGEAIGLRNYVQMALPDRVSVIVDQQLLIETDDEPNSSNSSSMRNVRIACITSILQVGICCSDQVPTDRLSIRDALEELQAIRDRFEKHRTSA